MDPKKLRGYVKEAFPELSMIGSSELRDQVVEMWALSMEDGGWESLDGIPFTLLIPKAAYDLREHTRRITQSAEAVARTRGDLDMDLVIAGGLTHDVGKLMEYERGPDGNVVASRKGRLLRHPVTGMELAMRVGAPLELQHIIVAHSKEGDAVKRIPEAILIHHCDFIDFEIAKQRAGM
ncbi:MAG: HDIG domain-containing protein [Candidatus Thermoplasmatota archaeon]|nr:HDIG domain-containing protein [Candidatus Thermoplasmatota archaeon]